MMSTTGEKQSASFGGNMVIHGVGWDMQNAYLRDTNYSGMRNAQIWSAREERVPYLEAFEAAAAMLVAGDNSTISNIVQFQPITTLTALADPSSSEKPTFSGSMSDSLDSSADELNETDQWGESEPESEDAHFDRFFRALKRAKKARGTPLPPLPLMGQSPMLPPLPLVGNSPMLPPLPHPPTKKRESKHSQPQQAELKYPSRIPHRAGTTARSMRRAARSKKNRTPLQAPQKTASPAVTRARRQRLLGAIQSNKNRTPQTSAQKRARRLRLLGS